MITAKPKNKTAKCPGVIFAPPIEIADAAANREAQHRIVSAAVDDRNVASAPKATVINPMRAMFNLFASD